MSTAATDYPSIEAAERQQQHLAAEFRRHSDALVNAKRAGVQADVDAALGPLKATIAELTKLKSWLKLTRREKGAYANGDSITDIVTRVRLDLNRLFGLTREQGKTIEELRAENAVLRRQLEESP